MGTAAAQTRGGGAVVSLNRATLVDGVHVLGSPIRGGSRSPFRSGALTTPAQVDRVFDAVDRLPVADRTRLVWNRFAPTLIKLDTDGDGDREEVFLAIEFPPGSDFVRTRTNPLTGEVERQTFRGGQLMEVVTPRTITAIEYLPDGGERASTTRENTGTLDAPVAGAVLERTQTAELWIKGLDAPRDPYEPLIAKLRVNAITGETSRVTFGLFPLPTEVADDQFVTRNRYSDAGILTAATVHVNGASDSDFARESIEKVRGPVVGAERFRITSPAITPAQLAAAGYRQEIVREDLAKGVSRSEWRELARGGRVAMLRETDLIGGRAYEFDTESTYRDDFHHGQLPLVVTTRAVASGKVLRTATTTTFDATTRELTATVRDHRGHETTEIVRGELRVGVSSALRSTETEWSHDGAGFVSKTTANAGGEEIVSVAATYEPELKRWRAERTLWFEPGVALRKEVVLLSPLGATMSVHSVDGQLQIVGEFDDDGIETATVTRYHSAPGDGGSIVRREDDYRWARGEQTVSVQTFVDGAPYDRFESVRDAEGRVLRDALKTIDGMALEAVNEYHGATERLAKSELRLGGELRTAFVSEGVRRLADGGAVHQVRAEPTWGSPHRMQLALGAALPRPGVTVFENGQRAVVTEWFAGTALPKTTVIESADGRPLERLTRSLEAEYDLTTATKLGADGGEAVARRTATHRGTDVILFVDSGAKRTRYGVAAGYDQSVSEAFIDTPEVVTQRFRSAIVEDVLAVTAVDVRVGGGRSFRRSLTDRSGAVLEVVFGALPEGLESEDALFEAAGAAIAAGGAAVSVHRYLHEAGSGYRGVPSSIEVIEHGRGVPFVAQRLDGRVDLPSNPHRAGADNPCAAWDMTWLDPDGAELYRSKLIVDARGETTTEIAFKTMLKGREAARVGHTLAIVPGEGLETKELAVGQHEITVDAGAGDWSDADFVALQVTSGAGAEMVWGCEVADAAGQTVRIANESDGSDSGPLAFWPLAAGLVEWLPDIAAPRYGATVALAEPLPPGRGVWVISVPQLAGRGLEVSRIAALELTVDTPRPAALRVAPIEVLRRGDLWDGDAEAAPLAVRYRDHSSGLRSLTAFRDSGQAWRAVLPEPYWNTDVLFDGRVVASVRPRLDASLYPMVTFFESSGARRPRPLYSIGGEDGAFLEYHLTRNLGDTELYTLANGFTAPTLKVFRAGILEDELSPGVLAYGDGFQVRAPLVDGLGKNLRNRIAYNIFKVGADRLSHGGGGGGDALPTPTAAQRAATIRDELPTLAEKLLRSRGLPWDGAGAPAPRKDLALPGSLRESVLANRFADSATSLVATSPGSRAEAFVDTVKEAELLELLMGLGAYGPAGETLSFYWNASRSGTQPLHVSYDARSGASASILPRYDRPAESAQTAAAQLAMARAALRLGSATGDRDALAFSRALLTMTLTDFRAPAPTASGPRGIADEEWAGRTRKFGFDLWPSAKRYDVETNALAYLLLERALELEEVRAPVLLAARDEQRRWLEAHVMPVVESRGIVPGAVVEIQDIAEGGSALAAVPWTGARAWLALVETAHAMGAQSEKTHRWLENLARVHGVEVDGVWGLDWTLALTRGDAISPELTARFLRVASLIGHDTAAGFAAAHLAGMGEAFPAAITAEMPDVAGAEVSPARLWTGTGASIYPVAGGSAWPADLAVYRELGDALSLWPELPADAGRGLITDEPEEERDLSAFIAFATMFYLSILGVSVFWWMVRAVRERRRRLAADPRSGLVPEGVMERAEERWVKRILGGYSPDGAPNSRISNAALEGNFIIQLKAIYKLVAEWRRCEAGWDDGDARIGNSDEDDWLNGADEFVTVVSLYMRWVIKAGQKDGRRADDAFGEHEDSNHVWSRLLLYFSEYYWSLLSLSEIYQHTPDEKGRREANQQIVLLLNAMGMRQRGPAFDARELFDFPANEDAFDLLIVQKPGVGFEEVAGSMSERLGIPERVSRGFVKRYKDFKRRESPDPVHPITLEAAKLLPHFLVMALLGVVWYNNEVGGLPIVPFIPGVVLELLSTKSLLWAVPLAVGSFLGIAARYVEIYRYQASMRPRTGSELLVFSSLTSLFTKAFVIMPLIKAGRRWRPEGYARWGWMLRALGFLLLGYQLLTMPVPSFPLFVLVKALAVFVLLVEVAAGVLPLLTTWVSKRLTARTAAAERPSLALRFINSLNFGPTRPASFVWLSVKYHYQFSVPSGGLGAMVRAVLFYFGFAALFITVGGYLSKEVLGIWFVDVYQHGRNFSLAAGALVFVNTMYLLRFGLYILVVAICSALATYPLRSLVAGALILLAASGIGGATSGTAGSWATGLALVVVILFEREIIDAARRLPPARMVRARREAKRRRRFDDYCADPERRFGVVYMSGDQLSYHKLDPEILMSRWDTLGDRLGSDGVRLLEQMHGGMAREELERSLGQLYELEREHDVTLWHPIQLVADGEDAAVAEPGLSLPVADAEERRTLLAAWHTRRWIVTMMSTAGNSQDTGINLIDIALRLDHEGMSESTVFYLIQNKYDGRDDNRPSQLDYTSGELGQREKLTRLLMHAAPGSVAYSLNDWTPFGFKAGGMMAMDLVHEQSLKLTNMLVLDRNANTGDLDALLEDITTAITDPGVVNIIPGRGTTNTLTPIGQGSQSLEEGHRELLKGVMVLGGEAGEAVGTGWGNIQAIYYGRVQAAMMDLSTPQLPLTTRQLRGCSFGDRFEGMIGFAPHAVGISEDAWAVVQATHNAVALGLTVKFKRSRAMWHKVRETWSHADWFSAFPRWAGGYLQMMQDPIMQRINDDGPLTVFAKEVRANNGRFFLSVPFAILQILLMPLAIIVGMSPFVQILIVLWNLGFIMNQVLTSLGLVGCLEAVGLSKRLALAGGAAAGLVAAASGAVAAAVPLFVAAGALVGGFGLGLSRWLFSRGRDMIMFGPQLVIHALGQLVRQSLEFVVSGAAPGDARGVDMAFRSCVGPREQQPAGVYANFVNMRTLVWVVGTLSFVLNVLALAKLDFLNVVLLLPSLLFSISCMAGPFLLRPRAGSHLGVWTPVPRIFGWLTGVAFYIAISWMVARRGALELLALLLFAAVAVVILRGGLRYMFFARRLESATAAVKAALAGLPGGASLAPALLASGGDVSVAEERMRDAGISDADAEAPLALFRSRMAPLLALPVNRDKGEATGRRPRFVCDYQRSLCLSLLTFVWFFLVPVPGMLVFSADHYRISLGLGAFGAAVAALVGGVLALALASRIVERWICDGMTRGGQIRRIGKLYDRFREHGAPTPLATASAFALFNDAQTFLDQRSYRYLRQTLDKIERTLEVTPTPSRR